MLCTSSGTPQGRDPRAQGRGSHSGRAEVDPGLPAGRVPAVRDHGQPVREQDSRHPPLGPARERRAVLHAHQCIVGQPEAQFGPLRTFVMGNSDHPSHTVLARRLQDYLRWRNAHARHPDVLAAQRRERARVRSERQQRWGRPKPKAA